MNGKEPLSPADWIKAAFHALGAQGVQAIRVEAIARDLQVSKGSFYWHFRDVAALKAAMLRQWAETATERIIREIDAQTPSPQARLHQLVRRIALGERLDSGGHAIDAAIRDWARHDALARETLEAVDGRRLAYLVDLFRGCGIPAGASAVYARLMYGALIGIRALAVQGATPLDAELRLLLEALLATGNPTGKTPG